MREDYFNLETEDNKTCTSLDIEIESMNACWS